MRSELVEEKDRDREGDNECFKFLLSVMDP